MNEYQERVSGLLETYDVAIAELEAMDDPGVACLLASLRRLRKQALQPRELSDEELLFPWRGGRASGAVPTLGRPA